MSAIATRPALGFLGVGWIGRQRLEAIAAAGVAEVAAVADPAVDGTLASLDELLAAGVDGVVACRCSARSRSRWTQWARGAWSTRRARRMPCFRWTSPTASPTRRGSCAT